MKRKIKQLGLFCLVLVAIFTTCIYMFRDKIVARYRPEIKQVGTIHINIKSDTSYINSSLEIKSRTFFNINVDTIKYKIDLFDKTYLQSTEFLGIKLPGYGKDTIDFLVKIPHRSLLRGIKKGRETSDSAAYAVNISLQVSTPVWNSEIPFSRSAKLKIPHPPELELIEIKYEKIRLRSIIADAKIKITNHTDVTLSVKDMVYKMKIKKQGDVKGNYPNPIYLKPKSATIIHLPIEVSIDHLGKILWNVLWDKDSYYYTLSMTASIEATSPVKESFHVELIKSGKMELKK